MKPIAMALAVLLAAASAACAAKENPNVTPQGSREETIVQVRTLQDQVRRYGAELRGALGDASPAPGSVRIGPAPCPGRSSDLDDNGAYYVSGSWQLPLAPDKQLAVIQAVRDAWQAKGYKVTVHLEADGGTRARLEGEDPTNGFTFSVISTTPPTAVAVRVLSTCHTPPDRQFPGGDLTVYN